jgi:CHAD domain-containing protein
MSQEVSSSVLACTAPADGKWVKGISRDLPTGEVAYRVFYARWKSVWHWLPLAAEQHAHDIEYVHQLRISTRRLMQAVRIFSDWLPDPAGDDLRALLRRVRVAADEARNWDVLWDRFLGRDAGPREGVLARMREQIHARRLAAQPALTSVYQQLSGECFDAQMERLLEQTFCQTQGQRQADRPFGRQANRCLKAVVKKFFQAAGEDLSGDEALHNLRIRAKKLRYTMEIVAVAFDPAFREKLYLKISVLQDVMGLVNDHAMVRTLVGDWLAASSDIEERAFLQGWLIAEARTHQDLREAFLAMWTPQTVTRLRRQFRLHCGLP